MCLIWSIVLGKKTNSNAHNNIKCRNNKTPPLSFLHLNCAQTTNTALLITCYWMIYVVYVKSKTTSLTSCSFHRQTGFVGKNRIFYRYTLKRKYKITLMSYTYSAFVLSKECLETASCVTSGCLLLESVSVPQFGSSLCSRHHGCLCRSHPHSHSVQRLNKQK